MWFKTVSLYLYCISSMSLFVGFLGYPQKPTAVDYGYPKQATGPSWATGPGTGLMSIQQTIRPTVDITITSFRSLNHRSKRYYWMLGRVGVAKRLDSAASEESNVSHGTERCDVRSNGSSSSCERTLSQNVHCRLQRCPNGSARNLSLTAPRSKR